MTRTSSHVRFVTRKWPPAVGGMETYCWELTQRLKALGSVDVIALSGRRDGSVPSAAAIIWFGIASAVRLVLSRPVGIVHAGDLSIWPLAWIAALRHRNSKIVISVHGSDVGLATREGFLARVYCAYLRTGASLLRHSRIITNSRWISGLVQDHGFRQVAIVPLATSLAAHESREGHNGQLFFAGRIMPSKGLSFLIQEVLPLLDDSIGIRVAGSIWSEEEASIMGRSARVEYLGVLSQAALAAEYQSAMCAVVPSLAPEGFGLVAVEAISCGGVVVASDHSGLAEVVSPETGFLVATEDAKAWADQIRAIRQWTSQERRAFVAKSTLAAKEYFNWDRVVEETLAVYRD